MIVARTIASTVAMLMLVVASVAKDAWYSDGLRFLALTYMFGDFILRIVAGYRRRRPHWTAHSWRRYLLACTVPLGALAIVAATLLALDMKLSIVGESRSALRTVWALGSVLFLIIGAVGMAIVVDWMREGDATQQFTLPRWLSRRRHTTT